MRLRLLVALVGTSIGCLAQNWEIGGGGGYGWSLNSTVFGAATQAQSGYAPRGAVGVVFDENMYNYIGGEFQYLFRPGGARLQSNGITETASGYSNILVYNLMIHMKPREAKLRPFVGAGAGIKIYTNSSLVVPQSFAGLALLTSGTQVTPAVSFDGGVKYLLPHHVQLRLDFRAYMSPTPTNLIRPIVGAHINGWIYDLIPMGGVAYVF